MLLYKNRIVVTGGSGRFGSLFKLNSNNVLNNPLNSLRWLLNTLSKQRKYLQKGNYVSTGTCTSAIPVSKKDIVIADFDSLGIVELQLK